MKVMRSIGHSLHVAWRFVFYFRKVFLAIPVIVFALIFAKQNMGLLPETVGLLLTTDGGFSLSITRQQAVIAPLLITAIPLVCMFLSRKVFYPWLISVVTLVVPFLLRYLNQIF